MMEKILAKLINISQHANTVYNSLFLSVLPKFFKL